MIDSYIVINRKIKKTPLIILVIVGVTLVIISIYQIYSLSFLKKDYTKGYIVKDKTNYYLKLKLSIDKIDNIINNNLLYIDNTAYYYRFFKLDESSDNKNQIIYLSINNLPIKYKINNYVITVRIDSYSKNLIDKQKE